VKKRRKQIHGDCEELDIDKSWVYIRGLWGENWCNL